MPSSDKPTLRSGFPLRQALSFMEKVFNSFTVIILLLTIFIYVAEGVALNPFTVWNCTPLFIAYVLYMSSKKTNSKAKTWGAIGFLIGSMALSGYFHLAWMFDWGETKTGASTAGLIFIFIPIYALITGGVGYFFGWGLCLEKSNNET